MENESYKDSSLAKEALRESHRERIRERIFWLQGSSGDLSILLQTMIDAGYEFSGNNDFLDKMIDDPDFANKVAEILEVETLLLISAEQMSQSDFMERVGGTN